jgi:hypothetical protein
VAVTLGASPRARKDRNLISGGATATLVGIALSTGHQPTLGGVVTVAGLVCTLYGLHRLGRSGTDPGRRRVRRRKNP